MTQHENFQREKSLSSSQKPNKFALQLIKPCKTFKHFQLGTIFRFNVTNLSCRYASELQQIVLLGLKTEKDIQLYRL